MVYNLTGLDTGNNLYDYVSAINVASGGYIFTAVLFLVWVALIIGFKNYETQTGFIAASAIVTLLTILAWGAGFVGFAIIFFPIAALLGGFIWKALS